MNSKLERDKNRLHIFHEGRKRRIFVGELKYIETKNCYELSYDKNYVTLKNAIPISPDLTLFKIKHISQKGKLFPAFLDRIPLRTNPAYADYCFAQNISINETNPIILLGSIGKKGPSSFIFESVYEDNFTSTDLIKIREELDISQHDFAEAFGLSKATLQRIEAGTSKDANTLKLIQIFFTFPKCGIWQLQQTGAKIHSAVLSELKKYFPKKKKNWKEFTKKEGYRSEDFLRYGLDHCQTSLFLFTSHEPNGYDSAAYLMHLGLEQILKAWHLELFDKFNDTHNINNLIREINNLSLNENEKKTLDEINSYQSIKYPRNQDPIEVGNENIENMMNFINNLISKMPPSLKKSLDYSDKTKKGNRVLMIKKNNK